MSRVIIDKKVSEDIDGIVDGWTGVEWERHE